MKVGAAHISCVRLQAQILCSLYQRALEDFRKCWCPRPTQGHVGSCQGSQERPGHQTRDQCWNLQHACYLVGTDVNTVKTLQTLAKSQER